MQTPTFAIDWEEVANSLTHGLGLALSCAGLGILLVLAARYGDAWHVVSCSIYGGSLVLVYAASTLYHTVRHDTWKRRFKLLDHVAIFMLIAGTYTPFTLVLMRDGWGWTLFGLVWACALAGIGFKLFSTQRFRKGSTVMYLAMGWLAVLFIKPFLAALPVGSLWWLAAGGLSYTVGVIFYLWDSLPFGHAIWHLFVLGGSACHYFAVLFYVLP